MIDKGQAKPLKEITREAIIGTLSIMLPILVILLLNQFIPLSRDLFIGFSVGLWITSFLITYIMLREILETNIFEMDISKHLIIFLFAPLSCFDTVIQIKEKIRIQRRGK